MLFPLGKYWRSSPLVFSLLPRCHGERGSNENTNGLLRQYFPKGKSMARYTQADLDEVADRLNGRPRQTLGWKTPSQALEQALR